MENNKLDDGLPDSMPASAYAWKLQRFKNFEQRAKTLRLPSPKTKIESFLAPNTRDKGQYP